VEIPVGYRLIKEDDFQALLRRLDVLEIEVKVLRQENEDLRKRLHLNSSNSSKPPSSDGYAKKPVIKNNREKSGKKPGGQPGHKGSTLSMVAIADKVVEVDVEGICICGKPMQEGKLTGYERCQELDIPPIVPQIIEYQILKRQCVCGLCHTAPTKLSPGIQYGPNIKSYAVYLNNYQHIPFERLQEIFMALFGISISDGFLTESNLQCFNQLEEFEQQVKAALRKSALNHCDETGMRVEGRLQWVHVVSNKLLSLFKLHPKRGKEAMDALGILEGYLGIIIRDRFASYDNYECLHAFCNAHLLRDLKNLQEDEKKWAIEMIELLLEAKKLKDESGANVLTPFQIGAIETKYDAIISGYKEAELLEQPPPGNQKKRGRKKKTKSLNLLEVFETRKPEILRFIHNPLVPFDNNLAERDLRMVKLKQKISGCFRTSTGAEIFCRIRSYISSAKKQNYNIIEALKQAILGNPANFVAAEQ